MGNLENVHFKLAEYKRDTLKLGNEIILDVVEEDQGKHLNKTVSIRHANNYPTTRNHVNQAEQNEWDARTKSEEKRKLSREAKFDTDKKRVPHTSTKKHHVNNAVKEEQKDNH